MVAMVASHDEGDPMFSLLVLASPYKRVNVIVILEKNVPFFVCFRYNAYAKFLVIFISRTFEKSCCRSCFHFFFYRKSILQSGEYLKKNMVILTYFSHFSHHGKDTTIIPTGYISFTYFAHPIDHVLFPNVKKIANSSYIFLFGGTPGADSYFRHFGAINKLQKSELNLNFG